MRGPALFVALLLLLAVQAARADDAQEDTDER